MPEPGTKRQRGCLFYGGITAVVLLLFMLLAVLLGVHYVKKMVNDFTDTKPMALPSVQMSPAEMEQVKQRVAGFQRAVQGHHATAPLALTGDEINALIATDPQYRALKGKIFVSIEGDRLKGQVSVPLDQVGLSMLKGRYLNGVATLDVSLHNGLLVVRPESILVKGKPFQGVYMDRLQKQNFAENANNDPQTSIALEKLQTIEVKDGKLVIVPKPPEITPEKAPPP